MLIESKGLMDMGVFQRIDVIIKLRAPRELPINTHRLTRSELEAEQASAKPCL